MTIEKTEFKRCIFPGSLIAGYAWYAILRREGVVEKEYGSPRFVSLEDCRLYASERSEASNG